MKSWIVFLIVVCCVSGPGWVFPLAAEEGSPAVTTSSKTLLQRLAEGESIGLRVDERLGGYALRLTTRQQARRFADQQATARAESEAAIKEVEQIRSDYREAVRSGRSAEDVVRLEQALTAAQHKFETVSRLQGYRYFDLIEVGVDHVVLKSIDDQPGMIIPAARIVSVELVDPEQPK